MFGRHPQVKVREIKAVGGALARVQRLASVCLEPKRFSLFLFAIVLFVTMMRFPAATASNRLDPSWMQAYGYFLRVLLS